MRPDGISADPDRLRHDGLRVKLSARDLTQAADSTKASFTVHVDHINFKGQYPPWSSSTKLHWTPEDSLVKDIEAKNAENLEAFTAESSGKLQEAVRGGRQGADQARQQDRRRDDEELREEERIVVYRILIQDLLTHGIRCPTTAPAMSWSELINSIFDVDKMLYFVAPGVVEAASRIIDQSFGTLVPTGKLSPTGTPEHETGHQDATSRGSMRSDWGGLKEYRARQLLHHRGIGPGEARQRRSAGSCSSTATTMRNAFLNAPWVKAVIPIRPGRSRRR